MAKHALDVDRRLTELRERTPSWRARLACPQLSGDRHRDLIARSLSFVEACDIQLRT
jgi:hypothetical protein